MRKYKFLIITMLVGAAALSVVVFYPFHGGVRWSSEKQHATELIGLAGLIAGAMWGAAQRKRDAA